MQPGFYPTTVTASADGSVFVGGFAGEIVKFSPNSLDPQMFLPPTPSVGVIPGAIVEDSTNTLWVCGNTFTNPATFQGPSATLFAYDLGGTMKVKYPFPAPQPGNSICEDVGVDASGNVYVTDAFTGSVFVLAKGATSIANWTTDALLAPNSPSAPPKTPTFGAHGITFDGGSNIYVSNFYNSSLVRIPINPGGTAGKAVAQTVAPLFTNPEALRMIDATHMLATLDVWGMPGYLVKLTQTAPDTWSSEVLRNNLQGPTSVVASNGSYWITEGQVFQIVDYLVYQGPPPNPSFPFLVERQDAE